MKRELALALLISGFSPFLSFAQCTAPTSTSTTEAAYATSTTSDPNFGFYE